ncbi:mechanosensitive channel MscK [Pseudomonas sp. KHPS1]|jgi:potassium efflux system protein|uniref:mechanosensitive channel MscK n=1 Tax=Ectopseudomonas hydrolytica TaxID=2493633 RepID=UPI000BC2F29E|nr:mechanosensitive channel MscK [Pseudomonas sp. KHPS1]ARS47408.1 potassium transporter KefA [Pseudomonas mendocina]ATH83867.1 mechanosensitive channel MscK [Pseudomonas mendocina]UTH37022.1 mechanosensitive channel MscK [Pseudomonas sp. KHPS1]
MPQLRRSLALILFLLCFGLSAAHAEEPPKAADVQQSLDTLADRKLPEAEQLALKQTLEQTLRMLKDRDTSEQRLNDLRKQLDGAPRLITEAQRELDRLKASPEVATAERHARTSLAQLEQLLNERSNQLTEWNKAIIEANSLVITAQTRPERAQAEISQNQARSQQINNSLKSGRDDGKPLTPERRALLNAELAQLAAQTQLRRQEMAGNSQLLDLGSAQRALLEERIRRAELERQELQSLINERRRAESEQTVAEQSREAERASSDRLLARESSLNLKLSDYLLRSTDRLNSLTEQNLRTRQQLDNLNQANQALDEQIRVLQGSLLLSRILYQQKQALPQLQLEDSRLADEIADIRLYQFDLNKQRDEISDPARYVDNLLQGQPSENVTPELRNALLDQLKTRRELLERLSRSLNSLLNESITLQLNQRELHSTASNLRATIDEQMFWIPSNKPLDLEWLKSAPRRLQQQLDSLPWGVVLSELSAALLERPLVFLPLLLLCALILWRRQYLFGKLGNLHADIGHYKRDSQLHTPFALGLNLVLALPVALFLMLCGYALLHDARGQNLYLGRAFYEMAEAWLVFYTLHRILAPDGVAVLHFHWPPANVSFFRRHLRHLGMVVMALVAVVSIAEHQPDSLASDVIGICVVLSCYALMAWLMFRLLFNAPQREHTSALRTSVGMLFNVLPLALIGAVAFGYYYTALKLTDRLIDTLYLLIIWLIVEAALIRGLSVAARRLAYQRALAKRQAQSKEGDGEISIEEPTLDIEQVNQQSLRLIRLALLAGFLVCLYWVWAELIGVFTYLETVSLYEYSSGTGDTATMVPISLMDVLGALIIVAITVALARNLPGLLEVLVLSRLKLAQGSAYATTTLLSYVLVGIGIVSTLSTLGVSWDKLQWLVAALSVGLGFGLQEIFANFISGLIILFERPVRIGDVVTIGNLSGTVSKIRIRATTITDFDHKEIIVPNKTFITGQLINWSLSDTVTRVTLKVGVSYGSDLDLVRKLLLQAAQENPRVLKEPSPIVYFLSFGESTLDHELRIHVRDLGDRNPATDEINRFIDREFAKHGINIAFRQVDVYVKNLDAEQHLQKDVIKAAAAGAADKKNPPPAAT